jgi:hypothetical protein
MQKLKALGGVVFVLVLFAAGVLALVALVKGGVWAAEHLLPALLVVATFVFLLDVALLLLSVIRPLRRISGPTLFATSYLFGGILWLYGLVFTYSLWGFLGVFIGLLVLGIGVVPVGMVATLLNGLWEPFFSLLLLVIVTFGFRMGGVALAASAD